VEFDILFLLNTIYYTNVRLKSMKTKRTYEDFTKIHMKPEQKVCEKCGTKLKFYTWLMRKFVITFACVFLLKSESQRCPNEDCENHKNKVTYASNEGHKYALKKSTFGLDIVAYVGFNRMKENKNYEEIHNDLNEKGIKISRRNVDYLYKSFEYLIKCSLTERLKCLKKDFDRVILDPPRTGLKPKVIDSIINTFPEIIIYISCNPATLARDLKQFVQHKYRVFAVQPIDMFPQTSHIENIVALHRE